MCQVLVLMATYNGESYVDQQIESIVEQSFQDWHLIVQDDGSHDSTLERLNKWALKEERITILLRSSSSVRSAKSNFFSLLTIAKNYNVDYFCFSDQDDFWYPEKLSVQLAKIQEMEEITKLKMNPALVHCDLEVVDFKLNLLHKSFVRMMKIKPGCEVNPARLLSRNEVTGCAMMFNKALLNNSLPIPEEAIMHDWWLAQFAVYMGHVSFIDKPLVKYRQHESNVIGAKSFWHGLYPLTSWSAGWQRGNHEFLSTVRQAKALHTHLSNLGFFSDLKLREIDAYTKLCTLSKTKRICAAFQLSIWRSNWLLNIVLFLRLLFLPKHKND